MSRHKKPTPIVIKPAFATWKQIATATGYKIFWGTTSRIYSYSQDVGTNLQYQVPNLAQGKTYYFSGKSYNASQTSPYGNEAVLTL